MSKIDEAIKEKVIHALNAIDELANENKSVERNDNGEAEQLEKNYYIVFEYIKTKGK